VIPNIFDRSVIEAESGRTVFPALRLARRMSPEAICEMIGQAGLAGKGGGGFPVHRKLALLRAQPDGLKHVVINGGEHEPGSFKDHHLLEFHSATVLEGALILAHAASARVLHMALLETSGQALESLKNAVRLLHGAGLGDGMPELRIATISDSYIVGEESALLGALDGGEALPRQRPPHPVQAGLDGHPTLVQNVETAAHLPYIVVHGAAAYRALSPADSGVTLCTFGPEFINAGVRLVPLGISLREVLTLYGGGLRSGKKIKAVQPGGISAGFLAEAELDVRFDHAPLRKAGSALGCGVIRAYDEDQDMAGVAAEAMAFFAHASCGQCPGCRMQAQVLARIMSQTLAGQGSEKLLRQVPLVVKANADKGICGFIHMPGPPVLSAMEKFPADFAQHIEAGGQRIEC